MRNQSLVFHWWAYSAIIYKYVTVCTLWGRNHMTAWNFPWNMSLNLWDFWKISWGKSSPFSIRMIPCAPEVESVQNYVWHHHICFKNFAQNLALKITPLKECPGPTGWGTALQAGSSRIRFPMVSSEFFIWHNPSSPTMALELTQPLI